MTATRTDPGRLALAGPDEVPGGDPACLYDLELFTGPDAFEDEPTQDRAARIAVAREVCADCPARLPCLAYVLRTRPVAGVWAGFTAEEITALADIAASPAELAHCESVTIDARTVSGDIRVTAGPDVRARSVSGRVRTC